MPKQKLGYRDKIYLKKLGKYIQDKILKKHKFSSLDRFYLENHELMTKKSLYEVCKGNRDFQFSTISNIAKSLDMDVLDLLSKVKRKK